MYEDLYKTPDSEEEAFVRLMDIIRILRSPQGCPWDKEQTHESLTRCMVEEAYEVVEAIESSDMSNLKEELGDVLLQVVMHAQIAGDAGTFSMSDVVNSVSEKMLRRHPHVFEKKITQNPQNLSLIHI